MHIKNSIKYLITFILVSFSFSEMKDLTFPGYNRLYYPKNLISFNQNSIDKIDINIKGKSGSRIKTDYNNKYSVSLELNNTLILYNNSTIIYSIN